MYLYRNVCSHAPNDTYKCIELHSVALQCCYYCLNVLSAILIENLFNIGYQNIGKKSHIGATLIANRKEGAHKIT